jgi:hypothetical protein
MLINTYAGVTQVNALLAELVSVHGMKVYNGMEVLSHSLLSPVPDGG